MKMLRYREETELLEYERQCRVEAEMTAAEYEEEKLAKKQELTPELQSEVEGILNEMDGSKGNGRSGEIQTLNGWTHIRNLVLKRDHYSCVNCGCSKELNVHHLTPRYAGGIDEPENLITLCTACHAARHMTLQAKLSKRFIERWAHKIAKWVDFDKILPDKGINFGPVLRLFNVQRFRPGQLEVILAALKGESILYISPTGSGKSLCFQLPAMLRSGYELIFSPLKTLMIDQVRKLHELNIPATFINSDISKEEKGLRMGLIKNRLIKFLYVAPERFGPLVDPLEVAELTKTRPSLIVLDEAHVLPKWQKSFRKDYGRIKTIRQSLGSPPILAFTATAGLKTQQRIMGELGADNISVFVRDVDRPNIFLAKEMEDNDSKRIGRIKMLVENIEGKVMIFVPTVKIGKQVHDLLTAKNVDAPFYHSKLKMLERDSIMNRFMGKHQPELNIVICTNAFGMGLDIPNIRAVIHWQHPATIEDYVQEYGRAGRDGNMSLALLFYRSSCNSEDDRDYALQKFMINISLDAAKLTDSERKAEYGFQLDGLNDMRDYVRSKGKCLREQINRYFDVAARKQKVNLSVKILDYIYTSRDGRGVKECCCSVCSPGQIGATLMPHKKTAMTRRLSFVNGLMNIVILVVSAIGYLFHLDISSVVEKRYVFNRFQKYLSKRKIKLKKSAVKKAKKVLYGLSGQTRKQFLYEIEMQIINRTYVSEIIKELVIWAESDDEY